MSKEQTAKSTDNSDLKVAIVHDWLYGGGAEKVVLELHNMYPNAPIYTSFCAQEWRDKLDGKVITGYLQNWPFSHLRKLLPALRQHWFARLDLSGFDLIISSSGNGEAKFARVNNPLSTNYDLQSTKQMHICYCHTPTHFYWRNYNEYLAHPSFRPYWLARIGLKMFAKPLRKRDYQAAQAVDHFIANSSHIRSDIKTFYDRDSVVVHPPVNTERFGKWKMENGKLPRSGFVTVGRQTPYKRTDILVEACTKLGLPLTVVGNGPENANLKKMAGPTIIFDTNATDDQVSQYMAGAEGFLFAAQEDFGITPVEAMAAGTPVIAYQAGGALDYVVPGLSGEFFAEQTIASLCAVLSSFDVRKYASDDIKKHAENFSTEHFHKSLQQYLVDVLQ